MLRPLDAEEPPRSLLESLTVAHTAPIVPAIAEADGDVSLLPRDHPKWLRDTLTVSQRTKDLIANLRPLVMRILTFWDHRLRSITVASRRLNIDPSGSYRIE